MSEEQKLLDYIADNYDTRKIETEGILWRILGGRGRRIDKEAGRITQFGYRTVKINKKEHFVHKLVFLWVNKRLPYSEVDHIDHNRLNNNPSNLRDATRLENNRNRAMGKNNKSGYVGVYKLKINGEYSKWTGMVQLHESTGKTYRKQFPLTEDGKLDAAKWVKTKRAELGFHANHGERL